jgi:hypothetical protein
VDEGLIQPRMIERVGHAPAYIIEEENLHRSCFPTFEKDVLVPLTIFIDETGHVHFEYNYCAYDPSKEKKKLLQYLRWFFDLKAFYRRIAPLLVEGSLLASERRLIGGVTAIHDTKNNECFSPVWAVYSRAQLKERGFAEDVRKGASEHLTAAFEELGRALKANRIIGVAAVAPSQRALERAGWQPVKKVSFKNRWKFFWGAFPISLRLKNIPYEKVLRC